MMAMSPSYKDYKCPQYQTERKRESDREPAQIALVFGYLLLHVLNRGRDFLPIVHSYKLVLVGYNMLSDHIGNDQKYNCITQRKNESAMCQHSHEVPEVLITKNIDT